MRSIAQKLTYDLALWLFNLMLDIFFREVRPRGSHKIPKDGPVIFVVAPHANQVKVGFTEQKVYNRLTSTVSLSILFYL
jgi:1-acyl-sn-glycerol-3-phosphate acyltransferase